MACAGNYFDAAIVTDIACCDINAACEGYWVGIPLADDCVGSAIIDFHMGCASWASAGNNVEDAIVVEVDGCNANTAGEGLIIGVEGTKYVKS